MSDGMMSERNMAPPSRIKGGDGGQIQGEIDILANRVEQLKVFNEKLYVTLIPVMRPEGPEESPLAGGGSMDTPPMSPIANQIYILNNELQQVLRTLNDVMGRVSI